MRTQEHRTRAVAVDVIRVSFRRRSLAAAAIPLLLLTGCGKKQKSSIVDAASVDAPLGLDEAGFALKQTRVEELVKACMKRAGFDYVPVDPNATRASLTGTSGLSDDEFRRQYGYGLSTVFEKVVEISQSGKGGDPNVVYRSHLDSAGQAAFDKALTGGADVSVSGAVHDAKAGDLSGLGGCIQEGTTAVFGDATVVSALAKIEDLDNRAEADDRLVKARGAWSKCMKQQGFDYGDPNAVDGAILDKLSGIVGPDAVKAFGDGSSTYSPLAFGAATVPNYDHAALAKLQAEELATAQADLDCEEKFVVDVEDKVKAEYVKKFAQQNAALITKAQAELARKK